MTIASELQTDIEFSLNDGMLMISPCLKADEHQLLDYELVSTVRGKGGTSNTRQSGRVSLVPGRFECPNVSSHNVYAGIEIKVTLKVFDSGKQVKEVVRYYPERDSTEGQNI